MFNTFKFDLEFPETSLSNKPAHNGLAECVSNHPPVPQGKVASPSTLTVASLACGA